MSDIPSSSASAAPRLAYLDGLRGWMALVVVFSHLFHSWLLMPAEVERYGAAWVTALFRWTPVGVVSDGIQAVYVFFAISGLALSYPVLRAREPDRTLAVMAIWRYPRLTVPILASCLIAYLLLVSGAFMNGPAAARHADAAWWANLYSFPPDFLDMARFALWRTYVPPQATDHSWNTVLWTMPVELGGSFLVFVLLALVRWRRLRFTLAAALAAWWCSLYIYGFYYGFLVGYLLAELLVAAERSPRLQRRLESVRPLGWLCLAGAVTGSLWLQAESFGKSRADYMLAMNFIATLAIMGVVLTPTVQGWLSSRVSRFLGRISFGLYLTHVIVICSFSSGLFILAIDVLPFWLTVAIVGSLSLVVAIGAGFVFSLVVEERLLVWLKSLLTAFVNRAYDAVYSSVRSSVLRILP